MYLLCLALSLFFFLMVKSISKNYKKTKKQQTNKTKQLTSNERLCFQITAPSLQTDDPYLFPWLGWTVRQCHRPRWASPRSLHRRRVCCGNEIPRGPHLYPSLTLSRLEELWLALAGSASTCCKPWWAWWWSAAAPAEHCAGFLLPKYPANKRGEHISQPQESNS